jgi:hypothetical protein
LSGLILVNPWLVEAESGAPPPAAIRRHYRRQLLSLDGWKRLLSGSISYKKLFKGITKIVAPRRPEGLAADVADGLRRAALPVELILASDDATAIAAADVWRSPPFAKAIAGIRVQVSAIASNAHTFSRPGDLANLVDVCRAALARLQASGRD